MIIFPIWDIVGLLDELEQLFKGIAMMKELTLRTRDYLVSFGECMSTRIFAALLNKIGVKARQVHSWVMNFGWSFSCFRYAPITYLIPCSPVANSLMHCMHYKFIVPNLFYWQFIIFSVSRKYWLYCILVQVLLISVL